MTDQASPKKLKRPRDVNQLAKRIADIATGTVKDQSADTGAKVKDPAAVSLGRRGGLKGGKARAESLSDEQRREIARTAAKRRWARKPDADN